ncbi:MAG: recombination mediator RecR [bacterium]
MKNFPEILKLKDVLQKLPLIGPKTSEKITFFLLKADQNLIQEIISSIQDLRENIAFCQNCFGITTSKLNPCHICMDNNREPIICVVEDFKDQLFIENLQAYNGKYHILEGLINPIEGKTPDKLKIKELLTRLEKENIKEVIFAIPSSLEGDITVEYISNKIKEKLTKQPVLSRLAVGIPAGGELEQADKITLLNAINNRKKI